MIDFVIADPVDGKQVDTSLEKPIEKDHIQSLKGVEEGEDILSDKKFCGAEVLLSYTQKQCVVRIKFCGAEVLRLV